MTKTEDKPVLMLVHGIWSRGLEMHWMARQLRRSGYRCHLWRYPSLRTGMDDLAACLARDVQILAAGSSAATVHYLAHSLGGLVVCNSLLHHPELPEGRVVCVGSPLLGSQVAHVLSDSRLVRPVVGVNASALVRGVPRLSAAHATGMIAGTAALGVGQFVLRFRERNDGTVAVSETRHPDLADHCLVNASHTGMLRSARVVRLAERFFREGRFGGASGQ